MSLLASLDRVVHATRLDFMTPYRRPRPRSLRWLPLLVLLALPTGYALMAPGLEGHGGSLWLGVAGASLFFGAYLGANLMRLFGPRLSPEQGPLDERELMLKARAGSISGTVITWLAILACFYAGLSEALGLWMPTRPLEYFYLGFGIQGAWQALPILAASWLQPADPEGD
jgi:hypothetical protein